MPKKKNIQMYKQTSTVNHINFWLINIFKKIWKTYLNHQCQYRANMFALVGSIRYNELKIDFKVKFYLKAQINSISRMANTCMFSQDKLKRV